MSELNTRGLELVSALERATGRSMRAMLEISDRCNEVCVHCYQEQGRRGEMTTEQLKAVIDELAEMGVLLLTITGGEATLRPDFLEILSHARKRSFAIRLFTNGLTMTRDLAAELHRLAVQVVEISLYSHRAEVHDFITGVPRSFERTSNGIRYLAELGVDVHVKSPMMRVNEYEMDALEQYALGLGASSFALDPSLLVPRELEDRAPERLGRSQSAYEATIAAAHDSSRSLPPGRVDRPLMNDPICGAGSSINIDPNGEIRPCTLLDLNLGDATKSVAHARATNAQTRELRAIGWKDAHGCRSCDLVGVCGRCFAAALSEVGDALAPYPTACANARSKYAIRAGAQPEIIADTAGRTDLGPYQHVEEHRFRVVADEITAEDDALAARLGWIRRRALPSPGPALIPGELVQLRRPGSKRPKTELVPGTASKSSSASAALASSPGVATSSKSA